MSTAKLDVWVTQVGDPCHIDNEHQWFVHVLDCTGRVLEWCGRRYMNIDTRCGHVEVEVPPGCYEVCATWSPGTSSEFLGNHLTHLQVIRVNCGDHACVTLFPPTLHHCGTWWVRALEVHAQAGGINRERAALAAEAVRAVLADVQIDPFTEAMEEIERPENKEYRFGADAE